MEVDLTNLNLRVWENAPRSVYNWNGTQLEAPAGLNLHRGKHWRDTFMEALI